MTTTTGSPVAQFPGAQSLVHITCSFEKYYEKLWQKAPALAWTLDADVERRTALEKFFAESPAQRQMTVDSWAA